MKYNGLEIAIIGMSGKFPRAGNIKELWEVLKDNKEAISYFEDNEIEMIFDDQRQIISDPSYIKARGILDQVEYFDAKFFGYTPNEALIFDPQVRLFHECSWEALEDAGYDPYAYKGKIGVFVGANPNPFWETKVMFSGYDDYMDSKNKDHLGTRLSYKFNLRGPSSTISTACSTSLVSVHMACRSILSGECDMAIAGGSSIDLPQKNGYLHKEGLIFSADGHVKSFDEDASGTVFSNGLGVVILKSLEDAIQDGDNIHAIIKGTATNNDGNEKVSFSAPSVKGQADVINDAMQIADVKPSDITYMETHGTATKLGDSIEIEALKHVFKSEESSTCGIGSIKSNIGHLNIASGIAGLIKTVLILKQRLIPASINYKKPNPSIDIQNSPFYVVDNNKDISGFNYPIYAGVSSFGVGGTNAHVILEEAPKPENSNSSRPFQLILQSAKTPNALVKSIENLYVHIQENKSINIENMAYTLMVGRKSHEYRTFQISSTIDETLDKLIEKKDSNSIKNIQSIKDIHNVVFLFPGQGAQYLNMAFDLIRNEPLFRQEIEKCLEISNKYTDIPLREILYPGSTDSGQLIHAKELINETNNTQLILFIVEYSLAKSLMKLGIKPDTMIGHSIGEYVAACISGVFSLEDAIEIVHMRGELMHKQDRGSMLSISTAEEELKPILTKGVEIAAVNSSSFCTVTGNHENISEFKNVLKNLNITYRELSVSHAFHSQMMDSMLDDYHDFIKNKTLNSPKIPFISNLTGQSIKHEEAIDPYYWVKHLRDTVRFEEGVRELLKNEDVIFIEMGFKVLSSLIKQHKNYTGQCMVNMLRNPKEKTDDQFNFLQGIGNLWSQGLKINWSEYFNGEKRHRLPLPTYPFEREKFWFDEGLPSDNISAFGKREQLDQKKQDIDEWFYIPTWKRIPISQFNGSQENNRNYLLLCNKSMLGSKIDKYLVSNEHNVVTVYLDKKFRKINDREYQISSVYNKDYKLLFEELRNQNFLPDTILYTWTFTDNNLFSIHNRGEIKEYLNYSFYSLLNLSKAVKSLNKKVTINIISDSIHDINGNELLNPVKATLLGVSKVVSQEFPDVNFKCVDFDSNDINDNNLDSVYNNILNESKTLQQDKIVAYRNNIRWIQDWESVKLSSKHCGNDNLFKESGTYLITGGMGSLGLFIAKFIAKRYNVNLILLGRKKFPLKSEWDAYINNPSSDAQIQNKLKQIIEIESLGSNVKILSADIGNYEQLSSIIKEIEKINKINGVIHAAGIVGKLLSVESITEDDCEEQFNSKLYGLLTLDEIFKNSKLDFFMVASSLASILGGLGLVAYSSANIFMDSFVLEKSRSNKTNWITVNWDNWYLKEDVAPTKDHEKILNEFIYGKEKDYVLERVILNKSYNQIIVSVNKLDNKLNQWIRQVEPVEEKAKNEHYHQKPDISATYEPPGNEVEQLLTGQWQEFFKYEKIGINDDFFELGGDSLIAVTLMNKIHKKIKSEISIADLFDKPTIKMLAEKINSAQKKQFTQVKNVEKKEYYPLSSAQKRMFSLYQVDKNNKGYNFPQAIEINGDVDLKRLEDAFQQIVNRHKVLRTSITLIDGNPVQRIHNQINIKIKKYSLDVEDELSISDYLKSLIVPFELSQAPLLNVALISLKPEKNILLIDKHHIITDAVSHEIFINELVACYSNLKINKNAYQYNDYSTWQQELKSKDIYKKNEKYWLDIYKNDIPVLNLPYDFKQAKVKQYEGNKLTTKLSKETVLKIKDFAKENDVTTYMILLSAYGILLSKYSNQEDLVVGSSIAGRPHADLQGIMGMFVNTLPIRLYPKKNITVSGLLMDVKDIVLNSIENQMYQFEDLVAKLGLQGIVDSNPLFNVVFEMHYSVEDSINDFVEREGLSLKPYFLENNTTVFDIILIAKEYDKEIELTMQYSTTLFKKEKVNKMLKHLTEIIDQLLVSSEKELNQVKLSHGLVKPQLQSAEDQGDFNF